MLSSTITAIAFAAAGGFVRGALTIDGPMPLWMLAPGYLFGILLPCVFSV